MVGKWYYFCNVFEGGTDAADGWRAKPRGSGVFPSVGMRSPLNNPTKDRAGFGRRVVMAIFSGIISRLRGSIGQLTFARVGGKTVVREKVEKKAVPTRTRRQMRRRVIWANLVNLYRAFSDTLHPSFEGKARGHSDYNEFMSVNLGANSVALTADEARQGGCVVSGYQVTRGSLPGVDVQLGDNNVAVTDLSMGGMTIGASTTVKTFSQAIVDHNPGWENGDQLTVFVAHQHQDASTGLPRVTIEAIELTLDVNDELTLLGDLVEANFFSVEGGKLSVGGTVNGGIAVVHSRLTKDGTKVSTQFFVVNNALLSRYQSDEAIEAAVQSYGGLKQDEFLTPNVDDLVSATIEP